MPTSIKTQENLEQYPQQELTPIIECSPEKPLENLSKAGNHEQRFAELGSYLNKAVRQLHLLISAKNFILFAC